MLEANTDWVLCFVFSQGIRHPRLNSNNSFSLWWTVITDVSQGFIFKYFSVISFSLLQTLSWSSHLGDNTLYYHDKTNDVVNEKLKSDFTLITKWFYESLVVFTAGKCHNTCENVLMQKRNRSVCYDRQKNRHFLVILKRCTRKFLTYFLHYNDSSNPYMDSSKKAKFLTL